jgi:hypothetical protein
MDSTGLRWSRTTRRTSIPIFLSNVIVPVACSHKGIDPKDYGIFTLHVVVLSRALRRSMMCRAGFTPVGPTLLQLRALWHCTTPVFPPARFRRTVACSGLLMRSRFRNASIAGPIKEADLPRPHPCSIHNVICRQCVLSISTDISDHDSACPA